MSNIFDIKRLYRVMLLDIKPNIKSLLIFSATIFLFLIFFNGSTDLENYLVVLYIGGTILTLRIFQNMHLPQQAGLYLMLPCSNLERFLSKWLWTSIGYAITSLIIFYFVSIFKNLFYLFSYKSALNLFQATLWIEIGRYIILQSIILLGAVLFKKNAFLKIALSFGCIVFLISSFTALVSWAIFYPNHLAQGASMLEISFEGISLLFWLALAPLCWYLTYLCISEYELK